MNEPRRGLKPNPQLACHHNVKPERTVKMILPLKPLQQLSFRSVERCTMKGLGRTREALTVSAR
jgi:hypothetical protein